MDATAERWQPPLSRVDETIAGMLLALSLPTGLNIRVSLYGENKPDTLTWLIDFLQRRHDAFVKNNLAELGADVSFLCLTVMMPEPEILEVGDFMYGSYPHAPATWKEQLLGKLLPEILAQF